MALCSWHNRRKGCHSEGPWQAWEVGPCETNKIKEDKMEGVGGCDGSKSGQEPAVCTCSQEGQQYPGLHQKGVAGRAREWIFPLCSVLVKSYLDYCCQTCGPQSTKHVELLEKRKGPLYCNSCLKANMLEWLSFIPPLLESYILLLLWELDLKSAELSALV